MKASIELDKLIGENVLGWSKEKVKEIDDEWFAPSSCISDAWVVVNEMERRGFGIDLWQSCITPRIFNCGFYVNDLPTHNEVQAETVPLAICLAALKAVEI